MSKGPKKNVMKAEELLRRYAAGERDFCKLNLTSLGSLRRECLVDVSFRHANLTGADLTGAETSNPSLYWCTFFHNTTMPDGSVIVEPTIYD